MSYLKPDPVYKPSLTISKAILSTLMGYILMGFIAIIKELGYFDCLKLWVVPILTGLTVALTNMFKQIIRTE